MATAPAGCNLGQSAMAGHGEKKGRKREQAVAALLSCKTVAEAAEQIGVAERTLKLWLADPEFRQEFLAARRRVVDEAVTVLAKNMAKAAETLVANLAAEKAADQNQAAKLILASGFQTNENLDQLERLEAVEALLKAGVNRGPT